MRFVCVPSLGIHKLNGQRRLLDQVLLERGEHDFESLEGQFKQGMPWKWADAAWKHKLRIENWPAPLKATFPGPGFDLSHIKDTDSAQDGSRNKAMREMHAALKAAYEGQEAKESDTQVVSWTDGMPFFLFARDLSKLSP